MAYKPTPQKSKLLSQEPQPLSPAEQQLKEQKRRRREMVFASVAFFVVLILTTIQLNQLRGGDALFVVMFNVNFVLLLGILLVVIRNGFELLLERRRRLLGSKLRTRLVLSFLALALLPCLLMFLVTAKYVQLSMDFWFRDQVENSMDSAMDLARSVYDKMGSSLLASANNIKEEVKNSGISLRSNKMATLVRGTLKTNLISVGGLYLADGSERHWTSEGGANFPWPNAKDAVNWQELERQGYSYHIVVGEKNDYFVAMLSLGKKDYLTLAYDLGPAFKARLDRIEKGSREYRNLRNIKRPLKLLLYSSLGVLTALIVLGAVWFGFRLARELSAPILALATGTERIARGDLSVRLSDSSQDEFGMLIRSFNRMAQDLETSRHETTSAYRLLEDQNRQIARHSKYIETVLNNIAAGVSSFDDQGRINTVNRAACEILDMTPEQLIGKKIEDFMPENHARMAKDVRERFRARRDTRSQHSITLTIDGEERRLMINVVGFSTEGVYRGSVAVFEDITELERMQRMAAWREVARRIAHEIKNPLTPIKLSAQRIARKFSGQVNDPVFSQSTELIVRQVEHLQSMVQEFSAFAKLPEVNPQPGRLEPLLLTVTDIFRNSHSGIEWRLEISQELPELPMDAEAMHRAFMNILGNAAEALTSAGTPDPCVHISVMLNPHLNIVRIDVADNGPGLTEEEKSRLFEPYFSRKKGGTGLGLTIVKSIVADHRGYVRALPNEGGGAVLTMELPLA